MWLLGQPTNAHMRLSGLYWVYEATAKPTSADGNEIGRHWVGGALNKYHERYLAQKCNQHTESLSQHTDTSKQFFKYGGRL